MDYVEQGRPVAWTLDSWDPGMLGSVLEYMYVEGKLQANSPSPFCAPASYLTRSLNRLRRG